MAAQPETALFRFNLGHAYLKNNKFLKAAVAYRKVLLLKSHLSLPATIYLAHTFRRAGKYIRAVMVFRSLRGKELPPNLNREFRLEYEEIRVLLLKRAMKLFSDGRYSAVLKYLQYPDPVLEDPEVALLLALSLQRLGKPEKAAELLRELLRLKTPERVRTDAEFLLKQQLIATRKGSRAYHVALEISGGYNSNIHDEPSETNPTSGVVTGFLLNGGYRVYRKRNFFMTPGYTIFWSEVPGKPGKRFINNLLKIDNVLLMRDLRLCVSPATYYQIFGTDSFTYRYGGDLSFRKTWKRFTLEFIAGFLRNTPASVSYEYLEDLSYSSGVLLQFPLGSFTGRIGYRYINEDIELSHGNAESVPLSGTTHGPEVGIYRKFSNRWSLNSDIRYLFRDSAYSEESDGDSKKNKRFYWSLQISRSLKTHVDFFISEKVTVNWSSLDDQAGGENINFTRMVTEAGLSWRIPEI